MHMSWSIPRRRLLGVLVRALAIDRIGQPCVRPLLLEQYEPDRGASAIGSDNSWRARAGVINEARKAIDRSS
jgi:hypothetical protein